MKTEQPVIRIPLEGTSPPGLFLLRLDFPLSEDKLAGFYRDCSAQRRERSRAYRRPEDRARCLAAGWLLNHAAGQHAGMRAAAPLLEGRDRKGRPSLPGFPGVHVSLSHSGGWAACAIYDRPVGVDVECARSAAPGMAEMFMSPGELAAYADRAEEERLPYFFRLWTRSARGSLSTRPA